MAGVSNQPNLKPLIDKQTQSQSAEFLAVNEGIDRLNTRQVNAAVSIVIARDNTRDLLIDSANHRDLLNAGFTELKTLLSSEIDSNGDLTVANLTSFKTAIIDEVQNSQSALNFTVSTSADAVLAAVEDARSRIMSGQSIHHGWMVNRIDDFKLEALAGIAGVDGKIDVISGELESAKTSILGDVATTKTAVINAVNAAKTVVLDEINSARVNILTTISGYITTAKNAIVSAVQASENRITANVNAKASGVKSVQRGVTTVSSEQLQVNITISSVNLAKSTLIISSAESVVGSLTASNKINVKAYIDSGFGIRDVSWQVIEYV